MTDDEDFVLVCPECYSSDVYTEYHQMVNANTLEHWCHSVKAHDNDSPASCGNCNWRGERIDLILGDKTND